MKFIKFEKDGKYNYKITAIKRAGWPWNRRTITIEYVGNCTVWRNAATGERAGTLLESDFCEYWWVMKRKTEGME